VISIQIMTIRSPSKSIYSINFERDEFTHGYITKESNLKH
jgi:hypothetical protein